MFAYDGSAMHEFTNSRASCEDIRLVAVSALWFGPKRLDELAKLVGISQSLLSYHVRVLRDEGLVEAEDGELGVISSIGFRPKDLAAVKLEIP